MESNAALKTKTDKIRLFINYMVFIVIGLFLLLPVTRTVPNPCLLRIQDFGLGTDQVRARHGPGTEGF